MNMNKKNFEKLVSDIALDVMSSLPWDLKENASDIVFSVADKLSKNDAESDPDYEDTLGLYEGAPLDERSFTSSDLMPPRITLYRLPILDVSNNIHELKKEIRTTILHELGHHFGFDENELEERGLG